MTSFIETIRAADALRVLFPGEFKALVQVEKNPAKSDLHNLWRWAWAQVPHTSDAAWTPNDRGNMRRMPHLVAAREAVAWLMRYAWSEAGMDRQPSCPEIARQYGTAHSTIYTSVRRVNQRLARVLSAGQEVRR